MGLRSHEPGTLIVILVVMRAMAIGADAECACELRFVAGATASGTGAVPLLVTLDEQ